MNIIEKILCILMINELKKRVHLLTPVKSKKNKDSNNASFFFYLTSSIGIKTIRINTS